MSSTPGAMSHTPNAMASRKVPAIGIDLGTWKCCVGVVREGKVEIIENEQGSKTTPSYVAFTGTKRLVGEDAKDQAALNPANTVFGVKRIIGQMFDDPSSNSHLKNFPFKTKKSNGLGSIEILVRYKRTEKWLAPEHITAMLLRKMKLTAEAYLGCPVQEAVVSVPACFNSGQRQATLDAAEIAGLKVLQLLHEPTAVALAYKDQAGHESLNQTVMVLDAGGGSLEVSVVSIRENALEVLATSSDEQFGGLDLDQLLLEVCVKMFQSGRKCDLKKNRKALERLRIACQKAKYCLSLLHETVIFVDSLADGRDFKRSVSREQFSQLISERVGERINERLKGVLREAKRSLKDIDDFIVVGGSTRVPSILNSLQVFAGKKLNVSINADEAVAHGAALQAALLAGDNTVTDTRIFDVSPRNFVLEHKQPSLWFPKSGVVFHKNWNIPCKRVWHVLVGTEGRQTLYLYECNKNLKKLSSLPTCTYNLQFEGSWNPLRTVPVLFTIDENCLFSAPPRPTEVHTRIMVQQSSSNNTSFTEIKKDEQFFQRDEQAEQERVQAISKLESSCFEFKAAVKDWKTQHEGQKQVKDLSEKCESILKACNDTVGWLDNNHNVDIANLTKRQTRLELMNKDLADLMRSAPQSGEEIINVPFSTKFNCFQCSRGILQEDRSLHSRTTATHPDKTCLQSRCNLRINKTALVKETKLQTDSVLASSKTHIETSISSSSRVENVNPPTISTSVPPRNSESNLNRTIDAFVTKLDTNQTNSSTNETNPSTVKRGPSLKTEINSPKSATYLEKCFGHSSSMESSPPHG